MLCADDAGRLLERDAAPGVQGGVCGGLWGGQDLLHLPPVQRLLPGEHLGHGGRGLPGQTAGPRQHLLLPPVLGHGWPGQVNFWTGHDRSFNV